MKQEPKVVPRSGTDRNLLPSGRRGRQGPAGLPAARWVRQAGADVRGQLTQLKDFAERWTRLDELILTFEDRVRFHGPAEPAYDVLYRAGAWPRLMADITRVALTEQAPGVQHMTLQRLTGHTASTTSAVRICFPHAGRIVYKQTTPAPLLAAHTGEWCVVPDQSGTTLPSRQTVVLREEDIPAVLGRGASVADARRHLRAVLGRAGLALLTAARRHAEHAAHTG